MSQNFISSLEILGEKVSKKDMDKKCHFRAKIQLLSWSENQIYEPLFSFRQLII